MKKKELSAFLRERGRWLLPMVLGTLGVLLLLLSGVSGKEAEEIETDGNEEAIAELTVYEQQLEEELERLCESAAGVSDVHVMVSFSAGFRTAYLTDREGEPITVGSGTGQHALVESLLPPTVSGVGVVCRRGGDPQVQATLTELISTSLGIPANHVFVTGK